MPLVIKVTSATSVNLGILTADLYSLFFGLFLFGYKVSKLNMFKEEHLLGLKEVIGVFNILDPKIKPILLARISLDSPHSRQIASY